MRLQPLSLQHRSCSTLNRRRIYASNESITAIAAACFAQQFSLTCNAQSPPPPTSPPQAVTCAVIVEKSCSEIFGDYPDPNGYCEGQACASADYCTTGEAMVVYYSRGLTLQEWTTLKHKKTLGAPEPGGPGRLWTSTSDSSPCLYQFVCLYECHFVFGIGNRCKVNFQTRIGPNIADQDLGPCVAPPLE